MANKNPDLYVIRVNARAVDSPTTRRRIAGALSFDVSRRADAGKGAAYPVDLSSMVVRPGDSITFELGDVAFEAKAPELLISWKFNTGKRWGGAPTSAGKVVQIPPDDGFAGARFSFNAKVDLNADIKLPSQSKSSKGTTVIQLDPDVIVDEC